MTLDYHPERAGITNNLNNQDRQIGTAKNLIES